MVQVWPSLVEIGQILALVGQIFSSLGGISAAGAVFRHILQIPDNVGARKLRWGSFLRKTWRGTVRLSLCHNRPRPSRRNRFVIDSGESQPAYQEISGVRERRSTNVAQPKLHEDTALRTLSKANHATRKIVSMHTLTWTRSFRDFIRPRQAQTHRSMDRKTRLRTIMVQKLQEQSTQREQQHVRSDKDVLTPWTERNGVTRNTDDNQL